MYRDFEDLRDNCPVELQADIAIDLVHDDAEHLASVWPVTADGGFRLSLVQAVSDFWEARVRAPGDVPDDGFAVEILVDSYADPDMGSSLYLELHAYCGTEDIGEACWKVLEDDDLERKFAAELGAKVPLLLAEVAPDHGLRCEIEVTEIAEL